MEDNAKCGHRFDGDHDSGWTCVDCEEHHRHVPFHKTVQGINSKMRLMAAEEKLESEIGCSMRAATREGLLLAEEAVRESSTISEARQVLREMIEAL